MKKPVIILILFASIFGCEEVYEIGSINNPEEIAIAYCRAYDNYEIYGEMYFKFTTNSDGIYRIIVSQNRADFSWHLYDDSDFNNEIDFCNDHSDNERESGTTPWLAASTTYYIKVLQLENIESGFWVCVGFHVIDQL